MILIYPIAMIVCLVLFFVAPAIALAYSRTSSRINLHSNAIASYCIAATAGIVATLTFPDLAWGWRVLIIAALTTMTYINIRFLNATRAEYEAGQQRSFVQATVEDDAANR